MYVCVCMYEQVLCEACASEALVAGWDLSVMQTLAAL